MDAYDIFKKLTKGLKFKTRIIGSKPNLQENIIKPEIKEEFKEEPIENESELQSDSESNAESDLEGSDESEDFEIVDGLKIKNKVKKEKKDKTEDLKKKLETEEHNRFRNEHGIRVVGRAVPPALQSFDSVISRYGVKAKIVEVVKKCGYNEPTPVQRQAVPCMLESRQILACAPTGSGKTAAFLLPAMHTLGAPQGGPRALILCPTRELSKQIYREALRLSEGTNLRCFVIPKLSENKMAERLATIKKSDIVISTPNRLCYLLSQDNCNIKLDRVKWLIIDEADKLFEGSKDQESDFRQQMEQILLACAGKERRIAMFSATHTPNVAKWCRHNMKGLVNITVGQRNAATSLVEQKLLFCGNEHGKLLAFRQMVQEGLKPPVLVFVQSKDRAKQLFKELIYDGINVDVIHADRTQTQRDNVVRSFRLGKIWVLICTELMGRGIDFCGVNLVLNYDFPPSAIAYIHRIGRAGRAGQKGKAVTLFTHDDIANLRSIASVMKQSGCEVPEYMLKLKQNPNIRKRIAKKAPHREQISTKLDNPKKRKLEEKPSNNSSDKQEKSIDKSNKAKKRKFVKPEKRSIENKEPSSKQGGKKKKQKLKNSFNKKTK